MTYHYRARSTPVIQYMASRVMITQSDLFSHSRWGNDGTLRKGKEWRSGIERGMKKTHTRTQRI